MWKGPSEGPDGPSDDHSKGPEQEQELKALKEQLARLKGMVSKPDSSVTEEKVEEYAHALTKMTLRAKRQQQKESGEDPTSRRKSEAPASEKVMLLRRQLEENKMRLAERGKSQKGMEEMVTQIKAQLDDSSQQLITQTPLNIPLIEDRLEYSPNTSPQELYNILLNKDKRISELNGKIGRLEANVLDLQENIREKDSVIDARTKAITLMSENLSKKSKSTLDALDETKEQMRRMQENFVTLEEQMKLEKSQLLQRLEVKEGLVLTLEERLKSSSVDEKLRIREQAETIKEKEKVIDALEVMVEKLKRTEDDEDSAAREIDKLKRQLDESNKNMIKVKAQHKSKVKELTKKVDQFKKLGDVHAEVVRLEAENSKYSQRIAELEEEKGQLQLAMVESKESIGSDDARTLEAALKEDIAEKIELVTSLESKNQEYEKQVAQLTEKLEMLTTMQTEKVTSDLTNAQYEEQLERVEMEKAEILAEKEKLVEENASLNEKIDALKREKQEITAKLDGYMQENIDLMDRLEKLSAEKVSSAESIEIVENLTQQEKLELEAYQKSLTRKSAENLGDNSELNESVNQLTEETSELIAKIELFTVERREVMEKMELLSSENNQLSLKIKEIENNRDVLVETYEQLQTEKETLDDKLRMLEESNVELQSANEQLKQGASNGGDVDEFKSLIGIQKQEIQELKVQLMSNTLHDNNAQILEDSERLKERVAEFERKLQESVEEVENYKAIIEENKGELVQSSNVIADLQEKIAQKSSEIEHYEAEVAHLNSTIAELSDAVKRLEDENRRNSNNSEETVRNLSSQLEELKTILDENIAQTRDYERELDENLETTKTLNSEIKQLNNRVAETENALQSKDDRVRELEGRLREKDASFQAVQEELRSKCLSLQAQIGQNADSFGPLQEKARELEKKNKEQIDKMKKLAANLKKKTSDFKDLEEKHGAVVEKCREKEHEVARTKSECEELVCENAALKERCSKVESDFAGQVMQHSMRVEDLQNIVRDYENQLGTLSNELEHLRSDTNNASNLELSKKDEVIAGLTERLESSQIAGNALQMKVHELEMYIESQEGELEKVRSQVEKLEGRLAEVEELTQRLQHVESELEQKRTALTENAYTEQLLEERVNALMESSAYLESKLKEAVADAIELTEKYNSAINERDGLIAQLNDAGLHLRESMEKAGRVENLDRENSELHKKYTDMENETRRLNDALNDVKADRDRSEGELQEEFNALMAERKALLEQVEVSREEIAALREELKADSGVSDDAPITLDSLQALLEELKSLRTEQSSEEMGADVFYGFKFKILKDAIAQVKSYGNSSALIDELEMQVQDLKQRLSPPQTQHFFEASSNTSPFDEVVMPKEEQMQQASTSNFFARSESKDDPFDFVSKESQVEVAAKTEESIEDLRQKIKTLEFMLFTVEKEKEAAVLQCQELSTELTRLVYERERHGMSELESQILVGDEAAAAPEKRRTYPAYSCTDPAGNNDDEEPMKSTSAFKCFGGDDIFGEDDDGWNADEAKLEQEHMEMERLRERVRVLELERENHLEDIRQAQVKSGKLIKKLKEFKVKNEQLAAKVKADDCDLNDAILDELKGQVETLEKKIKDVRGELAAEKQEKEALAKKVDVLTSANERMVEMKEKQDVEVMALQFQQRELVAKLEQFEWGTNETAKPAVKEAPSEASQDYSDKIEELTETVRELTLDNEELQALLEEQRNLRMESEKHRTVNADSEAQDKLREMSQQLQQNYADKTQLEAAILESNIAIEGLNRELDERNSIIEILQPKLESLSLDLTEARQREAQLAATVAESNATIETLQVNEELTAVQQQNAQLQAEIAENSATVESLRAQILQSKCAIEALNETIVQNGTTIETLRAQIETVAAKLAGSESEKQELVHKNKQLILENEELKEKLEELGGEQIKLLSEINELNRTIHELPKPEQVKQLQNVENELQVLRDALEQREREFRDQLERTIEEWTIQVDQRGSDVAESWKLHLESRENEFAAAEIQLRKEIAELDEKCNALVNENNELRRNVDADIKNEVDRVSGLQQQISDNLQRINALTEQLLAKDRDLELLRNECAAKDRDVATARSESDDKEREIETLRNEVESRDGSIELLRNEVESRERSIELLRNESADREGERLKIESLEKLRLLGTIEELNGEVAMSRASIEELTLRNSSSDTRMKELETKMEQYADQIEQYKVALSNWEGIVKEREYKIHELTCNLEENQSNNKDIVNLQLQLQDYQQQINNYNVQLQENSSADTRIKELETKMEQYADQIEQYKVALSNLEGIVKERDYKIHELTCHLEENQSNNKDIVNLQLQLQDYQQQINNYDVQLQESYLHEETLKQDVENYKALSGHVQEKDLEIVQLRNVLQEKEREHDFYLSSKTAEIDELRRRLAEAETENEKANESKRELETIVLEDEKQLLELKSIVEEQALQMEQPRRESRQEEERPADAVKAELDVAHYMLHQRDMRCEELTVELMQLLEERDTLQLRLSNALRENEELKLRRDDGEDLPDVEAKVDTSKGAIPKSKAIILGATGTELAAEATEAMHMGSLANKISELKSIRYDKDKTIVDEQELRRIQQMSILQHHKDDISKLPPEAAARLVDASYTLSRDVQSPSKVILNWLWGRSTPKVNNV